MNETECARCGKPLFASMMSKFNLEILCLDCKQDEKLAPNYAKADAAEIEAVKAMVAGSGESNFPGIGLAPEDQAFLEARRKARTA